ncbi:hypothetical protein KEM52_002532 [Ascosphaera acerosa]|nr:hypothetical protein KEM52_002532 [Ascosphaera acerosa]
MSYTYLPASPFRSHPIIIMTTNPSSRKALNLQSNPRVSLLVHDWVSHRPPTAPRDSPAANGGGSEGSPALPPAATRSSLASLLMSLNTSALSSISTTITGTAAFCDVGSEEEKWCKEKHLENNTFADEGVERIAPYGTTGADAAGAPSNEAKLSVGDDVRVVVVEVTEGRIADWKGGIKDWKLAQE